MRPAFAELRVLAARKASCLATVAEIVARGEAVGKEAEKLAEEADIVTGEIAQREAEAAFAGHRRSGAVSPERRRNEVLRKIVALRGAAELAQKKADEARKALPVLEKRIADVAVLATAKIQREALADINIEIPKLASSLARLIAADFVRHRFAGSRFRYDPDRHGELHNGAWLAGEVMSALARWSPADWPSAVDQAALRLADAWTREIHGEDNEDD